MNFMSISDMLLSVYGRKAQQPVRLLTIDTGPCHLCHYMCTSFDWILQLMPVDPLLQRQDSRRRPQMTNPRRSAACLSGGDKKHHTHGVLLRS